MSNVPMKLREIDFLNKFWSISGGSRLIKHVLKNLIKRRVQSIIIFLDIYRSSLNRDQSIYCNSIIHELTALSHSVTHSLPAMGCPSPGCNQCLAIHIDHYQRLVSAIHRAILCHFYLPGVHDEETTGTLMQTITDNGLVTQHHKETALDLVRHYVVYLRLMYEIIGKMKNKGQSIGINERAVNKILIELQSVHGCFRFAPIPVSLATPEGQMSHFYTLMARFHYLMEAIIWELGKYHDDQQPVNQLNNA